MVDMIDMLLVAIIIMGYSWLYWYLGKQGFKALAVLAFTIILIIIGLVIALKGQYIDLFTATVFMVIYLSGIAAGRLVR